MNTKFTSKQTDRRFQLWEYQAGHGQLLIRSPQRPEGRQEPERRTNVDLVFVGVEYLAVPRAFVGLELLPPMPDEIYALRRILGRAIHVSNVFIIASGGGRFPIVAASFSFTENDWDIFESPIEFRSSFASSPNGPGVNPLGGQSKLGSNQSGRRFQIWEYQVSLGHLLIRSPRGPGLNQEPERPTNVDLLLIGVEYMALPCAFAGLEVVVPTPEEVQILKGMLGKGISDSEIFILASDGQRYPIVAASFSFTENEWAIFESPIEFRSGFRSVP